MSLLAKNGSLVRASLRERVGCWLRGGHDLYFNDEFGGLWCYRCGSAWGIRNP